MPNDFSNKDNSSLILTGQTFASIVEDRPAYGVSETSLGELSGDVTALSALVSQQAQAESTLAGIVDSNNIARAALIVKLGRLAKGLEANPAISDAMLLQAGLAARPAKGVRPTSLLAPTGLTADGFSDGSLLLKWTRTNRVRTGFVVETSADGAAWDYVGTTMRTSFRAKGFAPGVPVFARVTAVNSDLASPPSNVASVYAPTVPAFGLKVA